MTTLRRLPLDELVATLVAEHAKMKDGISRTRNAMLTGNFARAKESMSAVVGTFRQHIADEEGQILRLLIEAYGRGGAEDALGVFRQHRPIYALMEALEGLSRLAPLELQARGAELAALLDDHAFSEENRIFPRALAVGGAKTDASPASGEWNSGPRLPESGGS